MENTNHQERTAPIEGYEGRFEITTDGRVFSKAGTGQGRRKQDFLLKQQKSRDGKYWCINLMYKRRQQNHGVHRLVATAFIPNTENKPQVNHINGNGLDNRVENLEWVSQSENTKHAYRIGLMTGGYTKGLLRDKCNKGHILTGENVIRTTKNDGRRCRICRIASYRGSKEKYVLNN